MNLKKLNYFNNLFLCLNFLIFEIFNVEFVFGVNFFNHLSNNFDSKLKFQTKTCKNKYCWGNIILKFKNEIYHVKFGKQNVRLAVKSLCNQFGMDNLYNVAFQCISNGTFLN